MEDKQIVDLYWQRDEKAIQETEEKYGRYLTKIAWNVLTDREDSRECVNDTYLRAWNTMPENRPNVLSSYLGRITRQFSIDRYRRRHSLKRQASEYALSLSELEECVSGGEGPEEKAELQELAETISIYLRTLSQQARDVFVCRYYYMDSISEIADYQQATESKIKSMLHRSRAGLKTYLEREGYYI